MLPGWYGRMGDELLHSTADDDVVLSSMRWVVVLRCFGMAQMENGGVYEEI